ncbi:MAG: choloylglycine hydrolase [Bulleidia sp.]
MCTAITLQQKHFYLGRNLDFDINYGQKVIITPANYPYHFNHAECPLPHYAIIGMGIDQGGFTHYFDAMNDQGLAMAGLNFTVNAVYHPVQEGKTNIAQFELIPYVLATCKDMQDVRSLLETLNIDDEQFSDELPGAQLHWIVADRNDCIVIESMKDGLHIHEHPLGVLTNNPPLETQMFMLNNYMHVSEKDPVNTFAPQLPLTTYSRGMGGLGIPGDLSSPSRFVKCAFTKLHSHIPEGHEITAFFHILHSVEQQDGCCEVTPGHFEITQYSDCMDTDTGILYYTTYTNNRICAVNMHSHDTAGTELITIPLPETQDICFQ